MDNSFVEHEQCQYRQTWFQASGNEQQLLPESAQHTTATKVGSLLAYKASDNQNYQEESHQADYDPIPTTSFQEYITNQPNYVTQLLRTLQTSNNYPNYLIQSQNDGKVTIATDGSAVHKKGYFAVVFHTTTESI
eukprot:13940803-Ditylum_brightwellii.AAC.1